MKKYEIVKDAKDFNEIINQKECINNSCFLIYIRKNNLTISRFGLAVGKKLGNAVHRNKYKRQLRMIINQNKKEFPKGFDYIIIMKGKCKEISYQEIETNLCELISKRRENEK